MRKSLLPMLALAATASAVLPGVSQADNTAVPVLPPVQATVEAPREVSAAALAFRQACGEWHAATAITPDAVGPGSKLAPPAPAPRLPSEWWLCDRFDHPEKDIKPALAVGGFAGAGLFFVALVLFCVFRGILISAWNWRLPIGSKSW